MYIIYRQYVAVGGGGAGGCWIVLYTIFCRSFTLCSWPDFDPIELLHHPKVTIKDDIKGLASFKLDLQRLFGLLCTAVLIGWDHRVHKLVELKQGQCICPLSWSVHCNFTGEGKCNERGWACTPHPHQPGQILPSSLNVRQKAAVATLCTLWLRPRDSPLLPHLGSYTWVLLASQDGRHLWGWPLGL